MSEFSAELDALLELGKQLGKMDTYYTETAVPLVESLAIPAGAAPAMAFGYSSAYSQLQESALEATKAVANMLDEVSGAVRTVSKKWKEIEEAKGQGIQQIN